MPVCLKHFGVVSIPVQCVGLVSIPVQCVGLVSIEGTLMSFGSEISFRIVFQIFYSYQF